MAALSRDSGPGATACTSRLVCHDDEGVRPMYSPPVIMRGALLNNFLVLAAVFARNFPRCFSHGKRNAGEKNIYR